MAIQSANGLGDAKGDKAETGMPKSIAPVRKVSDAGAYGQNRYAGASSLQPGEQTDGKSHSLVSNPDPNLDTIIQRGAGRGDDVENWQRRNVDAAGKANVADAFGMESARKRQPTASEPSDSLPAKPSFQNASPVRKPVR
jgi:hypothetical protein